MVAITNGLVRMFCVMVTGLETKAEMKLRTLTAVHLYLVRKDVLEQVAHSETTIHKREKVRAS